MSGEMVSVPQAHWLSNQEKLIQDLKNLPLTQKHMVSTEEIAQSEEIQKQIQDFLKKQGLDQVLQNQVAQESIAEMKKSE